MSTAGTMRLARWVVLLFLVAAADLAGAVPAGAAEAVEEGEEALHGAWVRRPAPTRTQGERSTQRQRPPLAPALQRPRWTTGPVVPARPAAAARKLPSSGPEPGASADDH